MASDLENNLIVGGLTPAAAKVISNAISNVSTGKTFTGRQLADATPVDRMRMIDGDTRRYVFTNLDYPGDSQFRSSRYAPSDRSHPYANSQPASANPTLATPGVKGGKFVEVAARTVNDVSQSEVTLRLASRGGSHARINHSTGEVETVPFTVEGEPRNRIEGSVEELPSATVIRVRLLEAPPSESGATDWDSITGKPTQFAPQSHLHIIGDITGLQSALDSKQGAGSYAATSHTHAIADVTGLQSALDSKAASSHTHSISSVTGLESALDGKQAAGSYAATSHTHTASQITDFSTAVLAALPAEFDGGVVT